MADLICIQSMKRNEISTLRLRCHAMLCHASHAHSLTIYLALVKSCRASFTSVDSRTHTSSQASRVECRCVGNVPLFHPPRSLLLVVHVRSMAFVTAVLWTHLALAPSLHNHCPSCHSIRGPSSRIAIFFEACTPFRLLLSFLFPFSSLTMQKGHLRELLGLPVF